MELMNDLLTTVKYKIQLYQVALLIHIEYVATQIFEQQSFLTAKIEEKKFNLKIRKYLQNLNKSISIVDKFKSKFNSFNSKFLFIYLNCT